MGKPVFKPCGKTHIHLLVSDMKRSIDFYTAVLGFFYDHGIREMAWLRHGCLLLTLSPGNDKAEWVPSGYFGWSLESAEQLEQAYQALHARGQRLSAPPDLASGRPYFFLYDPDDHAISFSFAAMDYREQE